MRQAIPPVLRAVLTAVFACAVLAAAQQPQTPALPEAPPPSAATKVVLPPRVVAGQPATLAVLDENGRLVPGAKVELDKTQSVTTDAGGRAVFTAPTNTIVLLAALPGGVLDAAAGVLPASKEAADGIRLTDVPKIISAQDHFTVLGSGFSGDASQVTASIGGQRAAVLAASPVALVLLPGRGTPTGPAELRIDVAERSAAPAQVTVVRLDLSSDKRQFPANERGTLTIRALGTELRVAVEARNLSPEVLSLPRGQIQRVVTRGGADNVAVIELIGLREGDFSISVRLVPNAAGLPDVETARLYLLAAQNVAEDQWVDRVNRLVRRLERDPDRPGYVRNELENVLAQDTVSGEFRKRLEAALRALRQ